MDMSKEQQLFKQTMLGCDDYTEEHFELDRFGDFAWIGTSDHFDIWELCAKAKQAEIDALKGQLEKAQAVPEKDAVIKKLSDQLYAQEMKASAARTLCETACELLDDYAHQDAMVILNDLEQAMIEAQEQKG